jgi:hypothetical protein
MSGEKSECWCGKLRGGARAVSVDFVLVSAVADGGDDEKASVKLRAWGCVLLCAPRGDTREDAPPW